MLARILCLMLFAVTAHAEAVGPSPEAPPPAPVAALARQFLPVFALADDEGAMAQLWPLLASHPLSQPQAQVTRAVIVIHDRDRDAAQLYGLALSRRGGRDATMLLAPQFPLAADLAAHGDDLPDAGRAVIRWPDDGWMTGATSQPIAGAPPVGSFAVLDTLLALLADAARFPALRDVVIFGFGGGANFAQRYALFTRAQALLDQRGIALQIVVASADSYIYLTAQRPIGNRGAMALPTPDLCPRANAYPYGLEALPPVLRRSGVEARLDYPTRRVTYVIGDDAAPPPQFDRRCGAFVQGHSVPQRAAQYWRYLRGLYGTELAAQRLIMLPQTSQTLSALLNNSCADELLFGIGACPMAQETSE